MANIQREGSAVIGSFSALYTDPDLSFFVCLHQHSLTSLKSNGIIASREVYRAGNKVCTHAYIWPTQVVFPFGDFRTGQFLMGSCESVEQR